MTFWDTARRALRSGWPTLASAAAVAAVHGSALCPTVFLGDSGEIVAAIASGGVAHPPGYPLFTLLGKAACLAIPWGEPAWRIGWVVVLASSLAAGFWVAAARRAGASSPAAMLVSLLLATSVPYGLQATRVEVYTVQAAVFAALLWTTLGLRQRADPTRAGWFWGLVGLSAAHHTTTLLTIPGLILLAGDRGRQRLLHPRHVCLVAPGLLLYSELLRRGLGEPVLDWGGIRDVTGLIKHASASLYGSWLQWPNGESATRIAAVASELLPIPLLVSASLGWALDRSPKPNSRLAALFVVAAPGVLFALVYGIPDIAPYLFVPAAALVPWVALGIDRVLGKLPVRTRLFGLTLAAVLAVVWTFRTRADWNLSGAVAARSLAIGKLDSCPPDAVLVTTGDNDHFPLVYVQTVLGRRRDVQLISRDMLRHAWLQRKRDPSLWYIRSLQRSGVPIESPRRYEDVDRDSWGNDGALIRLLEGPWKKRPRCTTFVRALPAGNDDPVRINPWLREHQVVVPRGLVVQLLPTSPSPEWGEIVRFNRRFWQSTVLPPLDGVRASGEVTPDYVARYYAEMLTWTAVFDEQTGGGMSKEYRGRLVGWAPDLVTFP